MNKIIPTRRTIFRLSAPLFGALACATLLGAAATPAAAREWDREGDHREWNREGDRGREWRGHEWREQESREAWRWQRPYAYGYAPDYAPGYYAPAPVYAPAPAYYGAPSFSLVVPLHIR
jgi:hypothetical protein